MVERTSQGLDFYWNFHLFRQLFNFQNLPQLGIAFGKKNATCHQKKLEGKMLISCGERWWWTWYANAPNFFLWNFRVFFLHMCFCFRTSKIARHLLYLLLVVVVVNGFIQFQVYSKTFRKKNTTGCVSISRWSHEDGSQLGLTLRFISPITTVLPAPPCCGGNEAMVALRVHGSAMQYLQKPMSEEMGLVFYPKVTFFFFSRGHFLLFFVNQRFRLKWYWNTFSGTIP